MSCKRLVGLLVAVGALGLGAAPAGAVIVYTCGANLCRINSDGGQRTQLTTDGQPGTSMVYGGPSLSRNGAKLAFVFDNKVIVGDANAANRSAPFASTAFVALMRPDGGAVAEIEETFSTVPFQVCIYNLDGTGRNCPYGTPSAGWAPDNNLLISVSAGAPNYEQEVCHEPANSPPCADDPSHNLYDPAVSPDGKTLAVTVAAGTAVSGHIALYNYATGQFERNLTTGTADDHPTWSPDGREIAFQRGGQIYVIAAAAAPGSEHLLTAGTEPTWGGPDAAVPISITVTHPSGIARSRLLAHGLAVGIRTNQPVAAGVELAASAATARKLGVGQSLTNLGQVVGTDTGSKTFTVMVKRRYRQKLAGAKQGFTLELGVVVENSARQKVTRFYAVRVRI